MSISFKDYNLIVSSFEEAQLEEGKIWDTIKKTLGGSASDDDVKKELWAKVKAKLGKNASKKDIEAEIERLEKLDAKDLKRIKQTKQSREFHQRQAERAARATKPTQGTLRTVPHKGARDATMDLAPHQMRGAHRRAVDRAWMNEDQLDEGLKEYRVEYTSKAGGTTRTAKIKAPDVMAVKEKFRRDFHGMKLVTVQPAKPGRSAQ